MKSYEEVARDVLRRRDEYLAVKKKKRAVFKRNFTAVLSCGLAVLVGFGIWNISGIRRTSPNSQNDRFNHDSSSGLIVETIYIGEDEENTDPTDAVTEDSSISGMPETTTNAIGTADTVTTSATAVTLQNEQPPVTKTTGSGHHTTESATTITTTLHKESTDHTAPEVTTQTTLTKAENQSTTKNEVTTAAFSTTTTMATFSASTDTTTDSSISIATTITSTAYTTTTTANSTVTNTTTSNDVDATNTTTTVPPYTDSYMIYQIETITCGATVYSFSGETVPYESIGSLTESIDLIIKNEDSSLINITVEIYDVNGDKDRRAVKLPMYDIYLLYYRDPQYRASGV